jgi:hypothetical protein
MEADGWRDVGEEELLEGVVAQDMQSGGCSTHVHLKHEPIVVLKFIYFAFAVPIHTDTATDMVGGRDFDCEMEK